MKKVFIFDFDGTFYTGENIYSLIPEFINKNKRNFLPHLTNEQYDQIVKENPSWCSIFSGADLAEHIYMFIKKYPSFNITIKDFRKWELNVIEPVLIDKTQIVDSKFIKQLCKEYPVYIVSNSDIIHIKHYMKDLQLESNWFKDIISNQFLAKDQTKKHYYKDILTKENCEPQNAYVFGDSIKSDLIPAQKLGINTFHITDARKIKDIVEDVINNY